MRPRFASSFDPGCGSRFLRALVKPHPDVYVFDLFTPAFCRRFLKETDRHEPNSPNTMNKYGLVLTDIGLGDFCANLLKDDVQPLVDAFFPKTGWMEGHHGFLVDYEPKKQPSLALHDDDSLVTLNVCLGREFRGGKLIFKDKNGACEVEHTVGQAVLHRGHHQHRALPVERGRRTNLILWCKKGPYR
jgi:hypothetical protein